MANENENEKKVSQDTPPVVDQKKDALEESKSLIKMADKLKQALHHNNQSLHLYPFYQQL